jgi:hypothetical protein
MTKDITKVSFDTAGQTIQVNKIMTKDITKVSFDTAVKKIELPTYKSDWQKLVLATLIECGWSSSKTARKIGCARETVWRWKRKFESEGFEMQRYSFDPSNRTGKNLAPIGVEAPRSRGDNGTVYGD